jgi:methionyl-tRNA formyltransferase
MNAIADLLADICVVASYGRILPDALIALPARGMINVHASLLPKYRGAAPIHRAVMAGDDVTGVTIMRVVRELDAGPMLAARPVPIGADATSVDVERLLAHAGAELLVETLGRLAAGEPVAEIAQDDRFATHAAKIERGDGAIDWTRPAAVIHNQVRGLHPWPHAFTFLGAERLLVHRTAVGGDTPLAPGAFTITPEGAMIAGTGSGALTIVEIQPEGRRAMSTREWLAGRRTLEAGQFSAGPREAP